MCNKVGGIYTVVRSKAALMKAHYDNYIMIGPYFKANADIDFEEKTAPPHIKAAFDELKREGIICRFGTWNFEAEPDTILIDFSGFSGKKNELKYYYWDKFRIDSMSSGWDFEEPMLWATAVGMLIEKIAYNIIGSDGKREISAHFHEWMAGFGGLYLKERKAPVSTVFTTHATMLGRSLSSNGRNLYEDLANLDPETEARNYGVLDKFTAERACANTCEVFTTVSEITGIEAEKILGRKPDVLVLNGLDMSTFPTFEEISIKHNDNRDLIREFISYYFFPYYTFDIDDNLIFFIVGRYEYKNKGIDIFTEALAKLNERLKKEDSKRTVTAIFWIPGDARDMRKDVLENKTFYRHMRNYILRHSEELLSNVTKAVVAQKETFTDKDLFSKDFMKNNKKHMMRFKRQGNPPLCTHYLGDENNDQIIKGFLEHGLDNKEDDRVKVILYPVYLSGVDGLIDLSYYDALVGCHLGVFPSYYEPWGYTPLESAALGVPAITTDLAGFGRFIAGKKKNDEMGISILKRFNVPDSESVKEFTELLYRYCTYDRFKRVDQKIDAKELSELADWKELVKNYFDAHDIAIRRLQGKR